MENGGSINPKDRLFQYGCRGRSLSPSHSIQSNKSQLNDNLITINSSTNNNKNSLATNNNNQNQNKSTNNKFNEIYDPEAPLESPEQQQQQTNNNNHQQQQSFNQNSSQKNSFKNNHLFNSSTANKTNGENNFVDMDIDSPFSPSKPISPAIQPKPSTSNNNNQSQPNQFNALKSSDLKLVLDHLIKAAQLQQQKKTNNNQQQQQLQTNKTQIDTRNLNSKTSILNDENSENDEDMPSSAVELNLREKVKKFF